MTKLRGSVLGFALVILAGAAACGRKGAGGPVRPAQASLVRGSGGEAAIVIPPGSAQLAQVRVEAVALADFPGDEVVAPGRIEFDPIKVSRIVLPVAGRIDGVFVRTGDRVAVGQPLFSLDSPDADAAASDYRQAQAAVSQMKSALIKAQADRDRAAELFEHKAVAKKDVLAAENELVQAQAALSQSEAARDHARRRTEILGLAEGEAAPRVTVKSPLSGKVIEMAVTSGEYRNDTTTPVMTVADLSSVWVASAVPENAIRLIDLGESLEVELVAFPGEKFNARVLRIADTLDPKTRAVLVRAELSNPQGKFRPEMYGTIRHAHGVRALPAVPARAILRRGGDCLVYVESAPGTFVRVPVVLGAGGGELVPVVRGIAAGDRVVVDGVMLLAGVEGR
jgi:membrane fusion protein, heavy metal efflux system